MITEKYGLSESMDKESQQGTTIQQRNKNSQMKISRMKKNNAERHFLDELKTRWSRSSADGKQSLPRHNSTEARLCPASERRPAGFCCLLIYTKVCMADL